MAVIGYSLATKSPETSFWWEFIGRLTICNSNDSEEAGARIRTADLLITNQLLYRLSYASVRGGTPETIRLPNFPRTVHRTGRPSLPSGSKPYRTSSRTVLCDQLVLAHFALRLARKFINKHDPLGTFVVR